MSTSTKDYASSESGSENSEKSNKSRKPPRSGVHFIWGKGKFKFTYEKPEKFDSHVEDTQMHINCPCKYKQKKCACEHRCNKGKNAKGEDRSKSCLCFTCDDIQCLCDKANYVYLPESWMQKRWEQIVIESISGETLRYHRLDMDAFSCIHV